MEILVIDGGSVDQTKEIVLDLGRRYSNIKLLENPGRFNPLLSILVLNFQRLLI
ncbi:MAG: hypothetical protein ACLU4N_12515 [Butyricimonas faecihominis]